MIKILLTIFTLFLLAATSSDASLKQVDPDPNWQQFSSFGQLSAVSTDTRGNIFVFHRGDRKWDLYSFDSHEKYTKAEMGPIMQPTIVVLRSNGSLLCTTGTDIFYLPHGITIDFENNVWITDVALHQVLKFPPLDLSMTKTPMPYATLTLGEALVPGSDQNHFCKPTSVAVDSRTGDFFVADGYCNSRIVKYDKNGQRILQWGKSSPLRVRLGPYSLNLPHSVAIDEKNQHLFIGDRENSRVLCYNSTDGKFMHQLQFGNHVYAVAFSSVNDTLLTVTGMQNGVGTVIDVKSWSARAEFRPKKWFNGAHDVTVSPDGRFAYVVELTENIVWRFNIAQSGEEEQHSDLQKSIDDALSKGEKKLNRSAVVKSIASESNTDTSSNSLPTDDQLSNSDFTADAMSYLDANQVAVTVVTAVTLFALLAVIYHLRRRGGASSHETRGLMFHEDE